MLVYKENNFYKEEYFPLLYNTNDIVLVVTWPAVYEEGCVWSAHDADELVHDPARHPRVAVLGPLARQRLLLLRLSRAAGHLAAADAVIRCQNNNRQ